MTKLHSIGAFINFTPNITRGRRYFELLLITFIPMNLFLWSVLWGMGCDNSPRGGTSRGGTSRGGDSHGHTHGRTQPKKNPKGAAHAHKKKSRLSTSPPLKPTSQKPETSVKLTLLKEGKAPRRLLRYRLPVGLEAIYQGEIRQLTTAPQPVGAFEVIYRFKLRQKVISAEKAEKLFKKPTPLHEKKKARKTGVKSAPSQASFFITYALEDVRIQFPKRMEINPEILEKTLNKTAFAAALTPEGKMVQLQHGPGPSPQLKKALDGLEKTLPKIHPRFPLKPVGTGAQWTQENHFPMKQRVGLSRSFLQASMTTTYKAISFQHHKLGESLEVHVSTKVGLKGTTSSLEIKGDGGGKGKLIILLDSGLVAFYKNLVKVVTWVKEQKAANTTAVTLKLLSLKRQDEASQVNKPDDKPDDKSAQGRMNN